MNEHEIDRLASAFHVLRPDWPHASLRTFIAKHLANRPRRDVAVALAWIACESNTATPARVLEAGPWWRAAGVEGNLPPRPPKPSECCHACGRAMHTPDRVCDRPTTRPAAADRAEPTGTYRHTRHALRTTPEPPA